MSQPDVILVDDEHEILEIGAAALRGAGYEVLPAISGDVALILIEQGLPFELLITDIVMPGTLDGFALARKARDLRPGIKVIYSTGFSGAASIRSRGAPYGDMLVKPWRVDDLVNAVRLALAPTERGDDLSYPDDLLSLCDAPRLRTG
jgi:DNA-binding NtrC family response regulator